MYSGPPAGGIIIAANTKRLSSIDDERGFRPAVFYALNTSSSLVTMRGNA
jgi:hypothetical protein